jgi:uncharacterized membrane protein YgcG
MRYALLSAALLFTSAVALPARGEPLFHTDVDDQANLFDQGAVARLQQTHPYRLRIMTERDPQGGPGLLEKAKDAVDSRQTVVIAIDPDHRKTYVRFGSDVGAKEKDYDAIAASGNSAFREKRWADGVNDIVARSEASMNAVTARSTQAPILEVHETPTLAYIGMGLTSLTIAVMGLFFWWNRRRERAFRDMLRQAGEEADRKREEANDLMRRNIEEQEWHDKMAARVKQDEARQAAVEKAQARRVEDMVVVAAPPYPTDKELEELAAVEESKPAWDRWGGKREIEWRGRTPSGGRVAPSRYVEPSRPQTNVAVAVVPSPYAPMYDPTPSSPAYTPPPPPPYQPPPPSYGRSRRSSSGSSSSWGGSSSSSDSGSAFGSSSSGSSSWGGSSSSSSDSGGSSSWPDSGGGSSSSGSSDSGGGGSDW